MAIYAIAHPYDRTWIVEKEGSYEWGPYEQHKKFQNWFKAKAAYDTIEPVKDCYNMPVKPWYMKLT